MPTYPWENMSSRHLRLWIMPTQLGSLTSHVASKALRGFSRRNPQVELEIRVVPWSIAWREILTALKRGEPPDVLQVGTTWMGTLTHLGFLDEVPDWVEERPCLAPWLDEAVQCKGARHGVPWVAECSGLIARVDMLASCHAQPEELASWDGFLALCHRIAEGARRDVIDPLRPLPVGITCRPEPVTLHNLASWLWAGGWDLGQLLNGSSPILAHESARPGFEILSSLLKVNRTDNDMGAIQPYRISQDFYEEGRFVFLIGHSWRIVKGLLDPKTAKGQRWPITYLPIPAGPAGSVQRGGGSALVVPRRSQNSDAAWTLVRHMISDEFMAEWTQASGDLPAHECAFWDDEERRKALAPLLAGIRSARIYPAHPMWVTIESILGKGLSDILWSILAGESIDARTQELARSVDSELHALLKMGWDLEAGR